MWQGLKVIDGGKAVFNSPAHVALVRKLAVTYKAGWPAQGKPVRRG
ncbi:hypothetical protein LP420_09020 [Massilia sp. B-10]|nr:hypothetical protein LP420_09020 [Massilia sp. B-10]